MKDAKDMKTKKQPVQIVAILDMSGSMRAHYKLR